MAKTNCRKCGDLIAPGDDLCYDCLREYADDSITEEEKEWMIEKYGMVLQSKRRL